MNQQGHMLMLTYDMWPILLYYVNRGKGEFHSECTVLDNGHNQPEVTTPTTRLIRTTMKGAWDAYSLKPWYIFFFSFFLNCTTTSSYGNTFDSTVVTTSPSPYLRVVFNMGNPQVNFRVPIPIPICTHAHVSWVWVSMVWPWVRVGGYIGPYFPTLFFLFLFSL